MIKLLNKILKRFNLQLISTKPDLSLVKETLKFMKDNSKHFEGDQHLYSITSGYVGDINYVKERVEGEFPQVSGTTYYQHQVYGGDKTFYNYEGQSFTTQELQEKLKDD